MLGVYVCYHNILPKENVFDHKYNILYIYCIVHICMAWCSLMQELGRLREMQFLELSENRLESLPAEMGHLTELQDCYLNENLLTDLPETFGRESTSYTGFSIYYVLPYW